MAIFWLEFGKIEDSDQNIFSGQFFYQNQNKFNPLDSEGGPFMFIKKN